MELPAVSEEGACGVADGQWEGSVELPAVSGEGVCGAAGG